MTNLERKIQNAFSVAQLPPLIFPEVVGDETLPSYFNVSGLASVSLGAATAALVRYHKATTQQNSQAMLDQRLANLWFGMTLKPINFEIPGAWDSIAGDYQTTDGWIRLHTNAPHHKTSALKVLGCDDDRNAVAQAVLSWSAQALETKVVAAGGCAAKMNSIDEWRNHEHGQAILNAPLVEWATIRSGNGSTPYNVQQDGPFPLSGIKVLDLTRVLAGPVASRFLAMFGADVLRIDPLDWDEPSITAEVTFGKRCAGLDLKTDAGRQDLVALLKQADVLLHGYRADALPALGFSAEALNEINPNLINVSLNAYGWNGPWQNRRGFDSLLQMSTGIAHQQMTHGNHQKPKPLPVQALDHATGYLCATSVLQALELRSCHQVLSEAKCSLAATAALLIEEGHCTAKSAKTELTVSDFAASIEVTDWGDARRVKFPVSIDTLAPKQGLAAVKLRSSPAQWLGEHADRNV